MTGSAFSYTYFIIFAIVYEFTWVVCTAFLIFLYNASYKKIYVILISKSIHVFILYYYK